VRNHIASRKNVTPATGVASCKMFLLPQPPPLDPKFLFPLYSMQTGLLLWTLWSCGRRASVVQAKRQIHRAGFALARRVSRYDFPNGRDGASPLGDAVVFAGARPGRHRGAPLEQLQAAIFSPLDASWSLGLRF
jgi:hypothetical protein